MWSDSKHKIEDFLNSSIKTLNEALSFLNSSIKTLNEI